MYLSWVIFLLSYCIKFGLQTMKCWLNLSSDCFGFFRIKYLITEFVQQFSYKYLKLCFVYEMARYLLSKTLSLVCISQYLCLICGTGWLLRFRLGWRPWYDRQLHHDGIRDDAFSHTTGYSSSQSLIVCMAYVYREDFVAVERWKKDYLSHNNIRMTMGGLQEPNQQLSLLNN